MINWLNEEIQEKTQNQNVLEYEMNTFEKNKETLDEQNISLKNNL